MFKLEAPRLILRIGQESRPNEAELQAGYQRYVDEYEDPDTPYQAYADEIICAYLRAKSGSVFGYYNMYTKQTENWVGHCSLYALLCEPEVVASVSRTIDDGPTFGGVEIEIGWATSNRHRNQGFATEGATALLGYCFDTLKLGRVIALTEQENVASIRVMEKLGMRLFDHPLTGGMIGVMTKGMNE